MAIVGAAAAEEDQFGIKIKDGHEHDTNGRNENGDRKISREGAANLIKL